jgi:RNA polymerase sigma factor (sigma-70 family)
MGDVDRIDPQHLSRIETRWSLVFDAHRADDTLRRSAARADLMNRYGGAVRRYLLACLRDVDTAEDLAQEFALRFLRGDFQNADPDKGRFRDFVKRAVYNLMMDHHRARRARVQALPEDVADPASDTALDSWIEAHDRRFVESWRAALLERAWAALARDEQKTGRPWHTILRLRVDRPELRSPELAEEIGRWLGRSVDANWARVNLHRARDRFTALLLQEVATSLDEPTRERVEQELIDLELHEHCREALARQAGHGGAAPGPRSD